VRILERKLEVADEERQAKAADATSASAGEKGFGFKNADGSFEFRLKGLVQADGRFFIGDEQSFNDTLLLRRIEPTFEITAGKLVFVKIQPQFAGDSASTADVYGELRFAPGFRMVAGKLKEPLVLENLQSAGAITFIERGLPTEFGASRDLGVMLTGEVFGATTTYAVGWFNGAADGRDAAAQDTDNHKELAARLFFEPFKAEPGFLQNLGFGIAGSTGRKLGTTTTAGTSATNATAILNNTLPRYRSPGQNTVFAYRSNAALDDAGTVTAAGDHTRLSPQLYFYRGSFGLLGEYIASKQELSFNGVQDEFEHKAWQGVASYVLTGEDASYKGVRPSAPYSAGGGWGALEIALRHGAADFDDDAFAGGTASFADPAKSVSEAASTGVAVNWYLTANARLALDYDVPTFDGGAASGDRRDEKALFSRLQFSF
jgi:phosphate-selective porin OprO and OprP